jgi:hypothetical protein
MAKIENYHSKKTDTHVYHNNNDCTVGNNIESYNRVSGTAGRPLCSRCKEL